MKRLLGVCSLSLSLISCGYVAPDAGQEAVLISKPFLFGSGGIYQDTVKTGRAFRWMSTEAVYIDMRPSQYTIHFDDLMTTDGVPLDFDAIARIRVTNAVTLITNFGEKWWESNVEAEVRNHVRQSVRKHGMNETAIKTEAIEAIDAEVSAAIVEYIKRAALPVELIQFTVGKANPPDSIKSQRIDTATQEQRILTEQQRKLAEDQRRAAELARATADNAYREALGLSGEQFVSLEQIKMLRDTCGDKPGTCTLIVGNGIPVIGK